MKHEREDKFNLEAEFAARYSEEELVSSADPQILPRRRAEKKAMRNMVSTWASVRRPQDRRNPRPILVRGGLLPAAYGSAIFTRGETRSLTTVTLGTKLDERSRTKCSQEPRNSCSTITSPPFSTGEARPPPAV